MNKNLFRKFLSICIILVVIIGALPSNNMAYGSSSVVVDDDGNEMYTVPVTMYDYKSDSEIDKGSIDNYYNAGSQYLGYNHYAFEKFNSKISNYFKKNDMKYPMYFGDFNLDGKFSNTNNTFHNAYWAINRANKNDMSAAVQGLVDDELINGAITQNSVELPYFNEDFLTNTKSNDRSIGKVVETRFPFRKATYDGVEYYEFDSENGKDNVWLDDNNNLKYSNDYKNHGVWDACHTMVSNSSKDGIGFFPFNNRDKDKEDNSREKLNFGFGLKMNIKFNIPEGGVIKNSNGEDQDIIFQFTGDDDVWVFIDGKLVLDIGGDHKKSSGVINFNSDKLYSKVSKVVDGSLDGGISQNVKSGSKYSLTDLGLDFSDPTEEHTLTMYYVERGMIESNMKIKYNFANNNIINVAKKVDNSGVNQGLKDSVNNLIENDDFNFNISSVNNSEESPISNGMYTKNHMEGHTGENGEFTLRDGENAKFMNSIETNGEFRVKEKTDEEFQKKYATTTIITNNDKESVISGVDSGNVILSGGNSLLSQASVLFTNKINTGNLSITKLVDNYVKERFENYENDEFTFEVKIKSLFGKNEDNTLKTYNLVYTVDGGEEQIADNGRIILKAGQTAMIKGIPVGTRCIINEVQYPDRYTVNNSFNSDMTIMQGDNTCTITNGAANEVYDLVIKKTIDDKYYNSEDKFTCNETYAGLTGVEQSFIFTIKQYDLPEGNSNRKVINEFYEVISFNSSDGLTKEKVVKNLPKGYYEVEEDTSWSWKYEFESVSVTEKGDCSYSYAKASNIDLGYSIRSTPVVEFINNIKYSGEEHDNVPEGDTAIENNILKK